MKLNATKIKNLKAKETPYKIFDGNGLFLYITPTGSKSWRYKYRFGGKQQTTCLGLYPDLGLAEAREKHRELREMLAAGSNPSWEKKKRKIHDNNQEVLFEAIARRWHKNKEETWTANYATMVLRNLEADIFPQFGRLPIDQIEAPLIINTLRRIQARDAYDVAHRVLGYCRNIFDYARIEGTIKYNPAQNLTQALKKKRNGHFAALDKSEIPEFLKDMNKYKEKMSETTYLALKMLMLTFVRPGELIAAEWSEIDLEAKMWTIPAHKMKKRKEHLVPLSVQVIAILKQLRKLHPYSPWLFPSRYGHKKHMSNNTILHALWLMGYKKRMTGHGFRAMAMTTIREELNYRYEVVDRQLAHVPKDKVMAAYDRSKFLDKRVMLMQDWANFINQQQIGCE